MRAPLGSRPLIFTILLVEDEEAVRDVTREVLESAGYRVLEASGPEEALRISSRFEGHIHLLLTDVVMPAMNGHDLAHRLSQSNREMLCVFMSGYANDAFLRESLGKTSGCYIQKPFTVSALLSRVSEALSLRKNARPTPASPTLEM